jgi:6-phosphogluconolactonase (cycloisomerase 2 family)
VDRSGSNVIVANYAGGSVMVFPIQTPNLSHVNRKAAIGEVGVDRRSPIW